MFIIKRQIIIKSTKFLESDLSLLFCLLFLRPKLKESTLPKSLWRLGWRSKAIRLSLIFINYFRLFFLIILNSWIYWKLARFWIQGTILWNTKKCFTYWASLFFLDSFELSNLLSQKFESIISPKQFIFLDHYFFDILAKLTKISITTKLEI